MERRSLFKTFFDYSNLISIVPKIDLIFKLGIENFKKENWDLEKGKLSPESLEFKTVDMDKLLIKMFADLTDIILIGGDAKNCLVDGKRLSDNINIYLQLLIQDRFSLLNSVTGGLSYKYKFSSKHRKATKLGEKLRTVIMKTFEERRNSKASGDLNLIDLIIEDDKSKPEGSKWTD